MDLGLFFICKVLSQITGPVKNDSRLQDVPLIFETRTDNQSNSSSRSSRYHTLLVEKHKTLNVIRGVVATEPYNAQFYILSQ
jgi:hypothetical protein